LTQPAFAKSSHHHHRWHRFVADSSNFAGPFSQADSNTIAYRPFQADAAMPRSRRGRAATISARAGAAYASADIRATAGLSFGGGGLVSVARGYLGTNPTGKASLWCGNFMNLVLEKSGLQPSSSNTARSFASYGHRISGPQVGAIAVMGRRGGGHVGIVTGVDANGNPILVSGNHNRTVAESVYPRGRIYAYVMPN
jgi:uncharacterized protein (TIGR02594 family)